MEPQKDSGLKDRIRDVQDSQNPVIPAQAGIQTSDFHPVSLDSRLRGSDEKNNLHTS